MLNLDFFCSSCPFFLICQLSAAIQVQKISGVPVKRRALVGWLNTIWAGDATPERGAFLKSKIDFANVLGSKEPFFYDPAMSFFMFLMDASANPFD